MATNPVDFLSGLGGLQSIPDPMRNMQEGAARTLNLQALRQKVDAGQREQDRTVAFENALSRLPANAKMDDYANIVSSFPELSDGLRPLWEEKKEDARQRDRQFLGETYSLLLNGATEQAAQMLEGRYRADLDAGQDVAGDRLVIDMVKSGDPAQVQRAALLLGSNLAVHSDGKLGLKDIAKEQREAELHPLEMRRAEGLALDAESDAVKSRAEADYAPDYYASRARKEQANAAEAETDLAWMAAKNSAAVAQDRASAANLYSLIRERGKATGVAPDKVSVQSVMAPIYRKVAQGQPLTQGENVAWSAYTRAPKRKQPSTSAAPPAAPAAAPSPAQAKPTGRKPTTVIRNPKTGQRMALIGGKWVAVK